MICVDFFYALFQTSVEMFLFGCFLISFNEASLSITPFLFSHYFFSFFIFSSQLSSIFFVSNLCFLSIPVSSRSCIQLCLSQPWFPLGWGGADGYIFRIQLLLKTLPCCFAHLSSSLEAILQPQFGFFVGFFLGSPVKLSSLELPGSSPHFLHSSIWETQAGPNLQMCAVFPRSCINSCHFSQCKQAG